MGDELRYTPLHEIGDSSTVPELDAELEALAKKYGRFMNDVARKVLSGYGYNHESVEDIVQDSLLAVFRDLQKGTVVQNQLAYLRTVTARRAVNAARSLNRRKNWEIEDEECLSRKILNNQITHDRLYEIREIYNKAWNSLSDSQKVILDMWLDGMTGQEIGEVMGIPRVRVNVEIHRARIKFKSLAQCLAE